MKRITLGLAAGLLMAATGTAMAAPKYVFYFIGDGMSIQQRNAAETFMNRQYTPGEIANEKALQMNRFPVQGLTTTYSLNNPITDSAASGTALATGVKTNNGFVGMTPDGQSHKTIAEMAKAKGMKVGIVTSIALNHATPASFYAKTPRRSNYYDIARQLSESEFDYFGGNYLLQPTGKKKDQPDAYDLIEQAGYTLTRDRQGLMAAKPGEKGTGDKGPEGKRVAVAPINYALDDAGNPEAVALHEFVSKGIELMENHPEGFFMMVEGAKIDTMGHQNDAVGNIHETLALDKAISVAWDFYQKHPEDTFILVTGDHETGGMTQGFTAVTMSYDVLNGQVMTADRFSRQVVQLRNRQGSFEEALELINQAFGMRPETPETMAAVQKALKADKKHTPGRRVAWAAKQRLLNAEELELVKAAWEESMKPPAQRRKERTRAKRIAYGGYEPLAVAMTHLLNSKAGIGWTSYYHSATPVVTSAVGEGAEQFTGYYDNVDVFKRLKQVMEI